jgi:hypothetical protein
METRGADQGDPMAQLLELGKILERGQMSMPPTNKNDLFAHL